MMCWVYPHILSYDCVMYHIINVFDVHDVLGLSPHLLFIMYHILYCITWVI